MQLLLDLDGRGDTPLQQQIFEQLRAAILNGRLNPGQRIPSSRDLCAQIDVSRNTVALAYERLLAEGYIETRHGVGTFVNLQLPEAALRSRRHAVQLSEAPETPPPRYTGPFRGQRPTLFVPGTQPLICDFRIGRPDPDSFPVKAWRRMAARFLSRRSPLLTQYGDPAGVPTLRAAIARHVAAARGIVVQPEQVLITAGVQEALTLVSRMFLGPEAQVVVEQPTYQGAAYCFQSFGAALRPVRTDQSGLLVEEIRDPPPQLAYVTPSHQFPLGHTLSLERRLQLLDLAAKKDFYIIEDDYDGDFRFQGSPLTALQGLDIHERVLYTTTVSKSIGAGLRLGYLIVPPHLVEPFTTAKALLNSGHPLLDQMIVAEFIDSGQFDNHLRRIRVVYMARRDCLMDALERHFGRCRITGHEGGMHLVWHLPDTLPPAPRLQEIAARVGVGIYSLTAGHAYTFNDRKAQERMIMLGYPSVPEARIRRGIRDLAAALEKEG
jgi:GntR family transcriptional regulator/MocR family aminotransferase